MLDSQRVFGYNEIEFLYYGSYYQALLILNTYKIVLSEFYSLITISGSHISFVAVVASKSIQDRYMDRYFQPKG